MSVKNMIASVGQAMQLAGSAISTLPIIMTAMDSDASPEDIRAMLCSVAIVCENLGIDREMAMQPDAQVIMQRIAARLDKAPGWKRVLTAPFVGQMVTNENWEKAGVENEPGLIVDENEARWFEACNAEEFGDDEPGAYAPFYDHCPVSGHGVFVAYLDEQFVVFAEN